MIKTIKINDDIIRNVIESNDNSKIKNYFNVIVEYNYHDVHILYSPIRSYAIIPKNDVYDILIKFSLMRDKYNKHTQVGINFRNNNYIFNTMIYYIAEYVKTIDLDSIEDNRYNNNDNSSPIADIIFEITDYDDKIYFIKAEILKSYIEGYYMLISDIELFVDLIDNEKFIDRNELRRRKYEFNTTKELVNYLLYIMEKLILYYI